MLLQVSYAVIVVLNDNLLLWLQVDESSRQREEINSLLAQVCDLQSRVQRFSHENDDLTANLRVYQVQLKGIELTFGFRYW